jgi:hypothetical protein
MVLAMSGSLDERAVDWLLEHPEPAIRYLTARDVLGQRPAYDADEIVTGQWVSGLLAGQQSDGGFGEHPYHKWTGGHWRLASLAELAAPGDDPRVRAATSHVLDWLTDPRRHNRHTVINGLPRRCASMEGLGLAAACRLGYADDARCEQLARWLVEWQWPDGGWNCDVRASGRRSSLHETHSALDGLSAYAEATGAPWAASARDQAAELLLAHRVFRPMRDPAGVLHPQMLRLRFPPYWHYDVLRGLVVLARAGRATDPRTGDALDLLDSRRDADGRWHANGAWWRPSGNTGPEAVDWGRAGPNLMITLQALAVRRAADRLRLRQPAGPRRGAGS